MNHFWTHSPSPALDHPGPSWPIAWRRLCTASSPEVMGLETQPHPFWSLSSPQPSSTKGWTWLIAKTQTWSTNVDGMIWYHWLHWKCFQDPEMFSMQRVPPAALKQQHVHGMVQFNFWDLKMKLNHQCYAKSFQCSGCQPMHWSYFPSLTYFSMQWMNLLPDAIKHSFKYLWVWETMSSYFQCCRWQLQHWK